MMLSIYIYIYISDTTQKKSEEHPYQVHSLKLTYIAPEKMVSWNSNFLLGWPIFSGANC